MEKVFAAVVASTLALTASASFAATKFIPLGHSELQQTADMPKFGSEQSAFNLQTDMYETRNYMRDQELRDLDMLMRRNRTDMTSDPSNKHIDY